MEHVALKSHMRLKYEKSESNLNIKINKDSTRL